MSRKAVFAAFAALTLAGGISACAPVTTLSGFQAVDVKPQDMKVGEDTRSTVLTKLGSPSAVATFDPNIWYYVTQTSEKVAYLRPQVKTRTVVAISFDKSSEKVAQVRQLGISDGYQVAYVNRETPTRGRELSVLEQLLGTIGRGSTLPTDNDPGQRPGGH
jgi:outer membrane protein assembly factor BamE (lipoprotein component of BamABCDE complex)